MKYENLKSIIKKAGMSETELAYKLGVKEQSVIGWCAGKHKPMPSTIRAMQEMFKAKGVEVDLFKFFY